MGKISQIGRPQFGNRRGILASIAAGWFLSVGVRFLLPAVLPQIKASFGIGNATAGFAITVYWAGYGLMQFPAGMLVDKFDERTILSLSLALAGGSLTIAGLAPTFGLFLAASGLIGLGTGLYGTTRGIALSRFFESNQGRAFGITLAAGSVGSALLPFFGGSLADTLGWRLTVGITVPLFFVAAASAWRIITPLPADADADPTQEDVRQTLRTAFSDRATVISFVSMTLLLFTFQGLTAFFPTYLIQQKGIAQGTASALFALLFIAGAGYMVIGGSAVDRYGTRPVILAIAAIGVPSLVVLPFIGGFLPLVLLTAVIATRVAVPSVLNPYIIANLPNEATGSAWGLLRTIFFLISATGSTVVGLLAEHGLFDEAFYLLAALTAVAMGLLLLLPKQANVVT